MADDITLTVRVRDMTRGEFNQIRQRMHGMDGDIRRLAQSSGLASDRAQRLGRDIHGVSGRLGELQRTGGMARHEMDFMRRSMGLMSRDLRNAARSGELTADEFRDLSRELEGARLDFDRLDNQIRRHSAVAQRAHREELARQREAAAAARQADAERRRAAAEEERRLRRAQRVAERAARERARAVVAAARLQAREEAAALRDAERVRMAALQRRRRQEAAALREMARMHAAALREEAQRVRRADAERRREIAAAAAAQQQQMAGLAGLGGDDQGIALRFRALGDGDMRRMTRAFTNLQRSIAGLSPSTEPARRSLQALNRDLGTMSRTLRDAQEAGTLTRREYNSLSNGLRLTLRDARQLRNSNDLTRSSFRDIQREVAGLTARMRLLGRGGNRFDRLGDSMLLLQRRLNDTNSGAGRVRRSLSRMGEGALSGLRPLARVFGGMTSGLGKFRKFVSGASRGMKLFLLVLGLIGPLAPVIGSLLTTVLGGAFLALGAFALRGEKDVRSAFRSMKSTIGSTVRAAAQPLRSSLVVAMGEVTEATREMGGALSAAFAATAPLVSDLVGGFTDLVSKAMPGFVASLQDMGPVIEGFREAMGMIGEGLGGMFSAMTSGGGAEGLAESWKIIGDGVRDVLINVGQFINSMSQSETATTLLKTAFGALSSILIGIEAAFKAIDTVLGPVISKMDELGLTGGALGVLSKVLEGLGISSAEVKKGMVELKDTEAAAAAETKRHATSIEDLISSLTRLADLNRSDLDARANQERVIDEATKGAKNYSDALKMVKGELDLDSEAAQKAYGWLSQIASATKQSTDAAEKANAPWEQVRNQWKHGYDEIVSLADGMGLSAEQARQLAERIVGLPPSKKVYFEAVTASAIEGLNAVKAAYQATPNSKKVNVETLSAEAIQRLEDVGFKVKQLPNGSFDVIGHTSAASHSIAGIEAALNALNGKTANTYTNHNITYHYRKDGASFLGASGRLASGGRVPSYATGGDVQAFPYGGYVKGPGTSRSDSITGLMGSGSMPRVSNTEFVVQARAVRKYGVPFLNRLNQGRLKMQGLAGGGLTGLARGGVTSEARQARGPIRAATSGAAEKSLLRLMSSIIKHTIKMATALKSVNSALEKAKTKLSSLKSSASSLSGSVKSGVMSATNVTSGVEAGKHTSITSVMGGLRSGRDKATAFASALKRLRSRGLSKGLLQQIAEAGIGGGGMEVAGALLSASGSELKSANSLHSQISGAASSAGKTTADAVYAKQIKVQEKLVKALDELSKALKKSVKKKAVGGAVGAASGGARGGLTWVGELGPELVRLPSGSSVSSNADSRRMAGLGAGSGESYGSPTILHVYIGEKKVDEIVLDSNRRTVRTRGGNVQKIFNQK